MINPFAITDYNRNTEQLQKFILFCVAVAGKNAVTTDKAFDRMFEWLESYGDDITPFIKIKYAIEVERLTPARLKAFGFGCYNSRFKSFRQLAQSGLDLRTCSLEQLENIHGIGRKTSRFFVLHSRKNVPFAVLDTHILQYLKDSGVKNVPDSTPQIESDYLEFEREFLKLVPRGKTPAEHDIDVWKQYRAAAFEDKE